MASLPSLSALLKSRDVEDPVNLYVHRPLAYAFVASVYRTRLTPNQVTGLATLVGVTAGVLWLYGARWAMVAGGALLWLSAILDGADGILARAKNMQSEWGRALDGSADMVVAACTVIPGFVHLWLVEGGFWIPVLGVPAIGLTVAHLYLYDFYKESYLRMTRPERGGEGADPRVVEARFREGKNLGWLTRLTVSQVLLPFLRAQTRLVELTNPKALREGKQLPRSQAAAQIYRKENVGPMRIWAAISLAPHSYLMAICGMADRLDVYLFIRLVVMNGLFVLALLWQRRATERTMHALSAIPEAGVGASLTA